MSNSKMKHRTPFKNIFDKTLSKIHDRDIYLIVLVWMICEENKNKKTTLSIENRFKQAVINYLPHCQSKYVNYDANYIKSIEGIFKHNNISIHDLIEYYNNTYEPAGVSHYTPNDIIKYMVELSQIKPEHTVADYLGGTGKILENLPECRHIYFNDICYLEHIVAQIALKDKTNITYFHEDFFNFELPKVDIIISNIPFLSPKDNMEILNKIKTLCNKAVLVVPVLLSHPSYQEIKFLDNNIFPYTSVNSKIIMYENNL